MSGHRMAVLQPGGSGDVLGGLFPPPWHILACVDCKHVRLEGTVELGEKHTWVLVEDESHEEPKEAT